MHYFPLQSSYDISRLKELETERNLKANRVKFPFKQEEYILHTKVLTFGIWCAVASCDWYTSISHVKGLFTEVWGGQNERFIKTQTFQMLGTCSSQGNLLKSHRKQEQWLKMSYFFVPGVECLNIHWQVYRRIWYVQQPWRQCLGNPFLFITYNTSPTSALSFLYVYY